MGLSNMKLTKDRLLVLVADLVQDLLNYGKDKESLIDTLLYYGLTEEEIEEWYGITKD